MSIKADALSDEIAKLLSEYEAEIVKNTDACEKIATLWSFIRRGRILSIRKKLRRRWILLGFATMQWKSTSRRKKCIW